MQMALEREEAMMMQYDDDGEDFWEFEKIVGRKWSFSIDLKQSNLVPDIVLPSSNKIAIRAISKDHNVPGYIENKMVFTPNFELGGKSDIIPDLA